jgi:hypothetical protein
MRVGLVASAFAVLSCATTFSGSSKVPNGAAGCRAICSSYGMELTGMVALGDYSDGCICEIPGKRASAGAATAAVAQSVIMQERARRGNLQRSVRDMDVWNPVKGNWCSWNEAPECFDQ